MGKCLRYLLASFLVLVFSAEVLEPGISLRLLAAVRAWYTWNVSSRREASMLSALSVSTLGHPLVQAPGVEVQSVLGIVTPVFAYIMRRALNPG